MHDFATIPRERAVVGIHRDAGRSRAPYRAKTKGEVECFIRHLHASFYVPMVSQLSPQGLIVDRARPMHGVGTWLREVGRAHAAAWWLLAFAERDEHPSTSGARAVQ